MSNVTPLRARLELKQWREGSDPVALAHVEEWEPVKITMMWVWVMVACLVAIGLVLSAVHAVGA